MEIFHRIGLSEAFRISHVIVAVMWMGLLWFFNFVQTPAYAEMEAGSRNNAFDKLTWRALWWFRWSAAATVVFGLLIIAIAPKGTLQQGLLEVHTRPGRRSRSASCSASPCSSTCGSSSGRTSRSSSPTPATLQGRRRGRTPTPRPRRAPARWRRARTRSSRCRCSSSWSAPRTSTPSGPSFGGPISGGKCRRLHPASGSSVLAVLELNALGKISGRGQHRAST